MAEGVVSRRCARLAITLGDPAGIGPEVAAGAFAMLRDESASGATTANVVFVGETTRLMDALEHLRLHDSLVPWQPGDELPAWPRAGIWTPSPDVPVPPLGAATADGGRHAGAAFNRAIDLAEQGVVDGIVTAPLNKGGLRLAGYDQTDHTTTLAARTGRDTMMCLVGGGLRVTLATVHCALRDVFELLTVDRLARVIELTTRELPRLFGIASPRVAVAGLNPHAGESGLFGAEESTIVAPAIERARAATSDLQNATIAGPFPPDTVFAQARAGAHDAVVALYHDQGLIPVKVLDFDGGVNITLNLPFVRTSPDHGTAYDLAGRGLARATSMHAAWRLAIDIALRTAPP